MYNHAAEEHMSDIHTFNLDDFGTRYRRKEKMKMKKGNVKDVYSAENVENYQGRKFIF